jgi:hypothetical protein
MISELNERSRDILRRIIDTEPRAIRDVNPDVPDWLVTVIGALHAKNPADRFQSAEELAKQLEACVAHVQHPTAHPLPASVQTLVRQTDRCDPESSAAIAERLRRLGRAVAQRRVLLAAGVTAGLLAIVSVVALGMRERNRSNDKNSEISSASVPAVGAAPTQTGSAATAGSASNVWHDGAVEQIRDLTHHVDEFETDAARFWSDQPPSSPSSDPVPPIRPQETTQQPQSVRVDDPAETTDRSSPKGASKPLTAQESAE